MEQVKKIALWTTGLILALIIVGCITLSLKSASIKLPTPPTLTSSSSSPEQEVKGKEIENYKKLCEAMQAPQTNLYDIIILKTLLPLFSYIIVSVLTYIFTKTAFQFYDSYMTKRKEKFPT